MANLTDYSWLSAAVYRRQNINQIDPTVKGWDVVQYISDNPNDVATYSGDDSGHFSAGVFCKGNEIVIAFTGTNTTLDEHLHTNMPAGVGVPTEQVRRVHLLAL
ncbi:MAG: hypothetical protein MESAZ_00394 [Saezia sanguinis]